MTDFRYTPGSDRRTFGQGRLRANLAALEVMNATSDPNDLTDDDRTALSQWCGWGACANALSDPATLGSIERLLGAEGVEHARRSTINAHYTPIWLATAMWQLVSKFAPTGRVLEPGCGHGVFIGTAPDPSRIVGIEKEPTTASIASLLYPSATIIPSALERTPLTANSFDAAIGNVPFADVKPYDRQHNPGRRLSLHNYAIWRALNAVRPGGIVALLTSRYTMDSQSRFARERFASMANLLTAVRFPSGAFSDAAGTQAIIDLLVFQRTDSPDPNPAWIGSVPTELAGGTGVDGWVTTTARPGTATLNAWWGDHPELVLGAGGVDRGLYSDDEYVVRGDIRDVPEHAAAALAKVEAERPIVRQWVCEQPATISVSAGGQLPGTIVSDGEGGFVQIVNPATGESVRHDPGRDAAELTSLCSLRDAVAAVLAVQDNESAWAAKVADLNDAYDAHVAKFGVLNRSKISERINKQGETVITRRLPKMGGFRDDPRWPLVAALEDFDETVQHASKAAIFNRRVLVDRPLPNVDGDPIAGLAACLSEKALVDPERIAELCAMTVDEVLGALASDGHIFHDPIAGRWVTRSEYLSGDVRSKLAAARNAARVGF